MIEIVVTRRGRRCSYYISVRRLFIGLAFIYTCSVGLFRLFIMPRPISLVAKII